MTSESQKKRKIHKKEKGKAKFAMKLQAPPPKKAAPAQSPPNIDRHEELKCDSSLVSDQHSHDIEINIRSLTFQGEDLVINSRLKLDHGRKYGLVSSSGLGKMALFRALGDKKMQIPLHMQVCCPLYNPDHGHLSVRQYVTSCEDEIEEILHNLAICGTQDAGNTEAAKLLSWRMERLEESLVEHRAAQVLQGLGFDREMQETLVVDLNDTWHMPLDLAKALILNPAVLLLDEPTHYLDLYTSIWLCSWLGKLENNSILLVKSNDVEFLSGFCNNFIDLHKTELKHYDGIYEEYVKLKEVDLSYKGPPFPFVTPEPINPPILQIAAVKQKNTYLPDQFIFDNANLDIDLNSRIALVGVKGAGKTTLLKILAGEIKMDEGTSSRSSYLRIGYFDQLQVKKLHLDQSVQEYVYRECPENKQSEVLRFWLSNQMCHKKTHTLRPDQKAALVFACLAANKPHVLLMDDPTKCMDFETIESLAMALRNWKGAFVLATNNIRLINDVICDIWICGSKETMHNEGDIMALTQDIKKFNKKLKILEDPTEARSFYPQFAVFSNSKSVTKFAEAVHPSFLYEEYIDSFKNSYKPNCIPFSEYKQQRAMVSNAPSAGLKDGDMQIQGEIDPTITYRMTTASGKVIVKSLLEIAHESTAMGECLSDFDETNVWVSPEGTALLMGVRRKRFCLIQSRRNYKSIHKIISDMCSDGGAIPPDIDYLLNMIAKKPEMSHIYHVQASLVPISQTGPYFMRMQEHVCRDITDTALKEHILMAIPYVEFGEWHNLFIDNVILRETYFHPSKNYIHSRFMLAPLQVLQGNLAVTSQQTRDRQIEEAENFLLCLRNRVKHRLDYFKWVGVYSAQGSDLATHARFSLVNCHLQEELERAKETKNLKLHEFL